MEKERERGGHRRRGHTAPPPLASPASSAGRGSGTAGRVRSHSAGTPSESAHRRSSREGRERRGGSEGREGRESRERRERRASPSPLGQPRSRSRGEPPSGNRSGVSSRHQFEPIGLSSVLPAGTLLMPPPMIGKPPLSGRRRSSLSMRENSQTANTNATKTAAAVAGSVSPFPVSRVHEALTKEKPAAGPPSETKKDRPRQPRSLQERFARLDVTSPAYLLAHVLRAVPVSGIHHWRDLQQKLAALRLMHFQDVGKGMWKGLGSVTQSSACGSTLLFQFHMLRVGMQMIEDYLEGVLFLDKSLVVRNLRSRRFTRQVVGWVLRLTSHTILDTFLLSVVTPILLASADHFPNTFSNISVTVPGLLRGFGCGCAGVLLQWLVIPVTSQLVNRGVVTVYEAVEYVLLRRYVPTQPDEDNDEDEEGDVGSSQAGSVVSYPPSDAETHKEGSEPIHKATEKPGKPRADPAHLADTAEMNEDKAKVGPPRTAEDAIEEQRLTMKKEKRELARRRKSRRAQREAEVRRAILRAIFYRVSGALVAQCVVEHPLNVMVELLRGRAMMHVCGLFSYYDNSADVDALSWVGLKSFCRRTFLPTVRREQVDNADEVPQWVRLLRQLGAGIGVEIQMVIECVQRASGQAEAIYRLKQHAVDTIRAGGRPSAWESVELMVRCALSFAPLYYDVQLSAVDRLLGFYMAIWTRLTKM